MRLAISLSLSLLSIPLICSLAAIATEPDTHGSPATTDLFSGQPRLLIVHGYSTSQHWWAFLQRKIDRHMGGPDKRTIEVQLCNKGGTPIAKWMNVETGERSAAWKAMLTPMIQAEQGKRPVIVLCQQSLQGVYSSDQKIGIRNAEDQHRIDRGADVLRQYGNSILEDGAAQVVIAMHIFKQSMEPAIGNERFALAKLIDQNPAKLFAGPDVWEPTSKQFPLAFDTDQAHPNFIGAEIMAHFWFSALLEREGLKVPAWSREEMDDAVRDKPLGVTRNNEVFADKLKEWKIVSRRPIELSTASPQSDIGGMANLILRHDKNGDAQVSKEEFQGPVRLFQRFDNNSDGILSKDEISKATSR